MKKTVAGILIALVACLGFTAYFFLAINPPGTWHDLFTPEDWTFVVQYADASNPHFYQLDIDKEEFVETSSSQKNLA